ncbi:MAG: hypothetical protein GVY31_08870 [Alphaproteobacteria bacterium]|jgi:hypothetical protein|nr:hypothetical protein [Alphaproteobacteria bacterium]
MTSILNLNLVVLAVVCICYVLIQGVDYGGPSIYLAAGVLAAGIGMSIRPREIDPMGIDGVGRYFLIPVIAVIVYLSALVTVGLPVALISEITGIGA